MQKRLNQESKIINYNMKRKEKKKVARRK